MTMKHLPLFALALGSLALSSAPVHASNSDQDHLGVGPRLHTSAEYVAPNSWVKNGKVMSVSGNWLIGGQAGGGAQKEFLGTCIEEDGTVNTTQALRWDSAKKRWALFCENGGQLLVADRSDFFARSKAGVKKRGSINPLTATYIKNGKRRILCMAMLPNEQSIPGYMDIPARGRVPSKCKIKFGGNVVGVPKWRVYEGNTSTPMPRYNTWWSVGERMVAGSLSPLFAARVPGGGPMLCRGVDRHTGMAHPGVLSGHKCLISVNYWTPQHTNEPAQVLRESFAFYLEQRNPGLKWSRPLTTVPSDALNFNAGNNHSPGSVYACRRSGSDKLGYVRGGQCRVPGSTDTGPFRVLLAPGSDRG
jgi:hypothetical protein